MGFGHRKNGGHSVRVWQINFSDLSGGAARAAYRLHHALRVAGVDSRMQVVKTTSGDWTVSSPKDALFKFGTMIRPQLAALVRGMQKSPPRTPLSPALLPSRWPALLNESEADLVHLHWICGEMMSIEDIGRIKKPVLWTLHDMWAFAGAEHCPWDDRWVQGYTRLNRCPDESGFDLNRWIWNRKRSAWKRPMQIVTPSRWLADCVRQSVLMRDWPVETIPNAIDTEAWQPIERNLARRLMGFPVESRVVAFGAMSTGAVVPHKGFDLLLPTLAHLRGQIPGLELVVFGQLRPKNPPDLGFPVHYTGHLHDDLSLRTLYSAADVMIIPSRIDNLPNTGVEALACGTPVVAFDTCGLPDIVAHQKTGWLAKAFDTEDLACGIVWVLADENRYVQLSEAARKDAVARYSYPVVAAQYKALYHRLLGG